ncbi:MAG: hypothetical protein R2844_07645 [Caldilineales bacterium]
MTTATPGYTNGATVAGQGAAEEQSEFYKSAVRFTRLYAMFSPTMVGLLLAKKTRYGRFIPLPDALPDDFKLGKWTFNRSAGNGDNAAADDAAGEDALEAGADDATGSDAAGGAGATARNGGGGSTYPAAPAPTVTAARTAGHPAVVQPPA